MDDLDEETKINILRNIGQLFPNVSDLSFFRQVFDNLNWDLEKSLERIKHLLEDADSEDTVDNDPLPNNNARIANPTPEFSRVAPNSVPSSNNQPLRGFSSLKISAPTSSKLLYSTSITKAGAVPKSIASEKKVATASKAQRKEKLQKAYNEGLKQKNPVLRIKSFALEGVKVMIIMRGCPGSGKTYLVQHLANSLSLEQSKALGSTEAHPVDHHIFSADDFWINPAGKYVFNAEYIEYAHRWNQKLVRQAASEGRSPIFVDNTHTRLWEMQAVATIAVEYGYVIEIIDSKEANKKWAFNVSELVRRNVHGVHYDAIKRMVERYELDIQPKHLFKTYNLQYQPNVTPPQRCLVTFSTPPSKGQMKIFNTRFHCASMKDILALKSSEPGTENLVNVGSKTKNPFGAQLASDGAISDPRNPKIYTTFSELRAAQTRNVAVPDPQNQKIYTLTELRNRKEGQIFPGNDVLGSNARVPGIIDFPQKDGNSAAYAPHFPFQDSPFGFNAERSSYLLQGAQSGWHNELKTHPNQNLYSSTTASDTAETSVDLLLSMNGEIRDTGPNQLLLPEQVSKNTDSSVVDFLNGNLTNKFDSGSDLLLSFEDTSLETSKSLCTSNVSHHSPEESPANSQVSLCNEDDSMDACDDSDSSCEDIPMTLPADSCNEFGQTVTSEYVLVQPDGNIIFQNSHNRLPVSLREFVASSKMEKLKNKLARSAAQYDSGSAVKKLMKPFFKSLSDVPMYADNKLLLNEDSAACLELTSKSTRPSMDLGQSTGNEAATHSQSSDSLGNVSDRSEMFPTQPNSTHLEQECQNETVNVIEGMTPEEFINQVWGQGSSNSSAKNEKRPMKFDSSAEITTSAEIVPIVESTWSNSGEPEPVQIQRTDSPKGQRSLVERTLTKMFDKGTDANYFEILSKANTSDALGHNDVILFGNSSAFQSSTSPPRQDCIKAVATHEKSSMTKSDESTDEIDSGVEILTKMFPDVSLDCLVDLFEKCQKNLYWTANLLMDSGEEISAHFNADVTPKKESPPPSPSPLTEIASEPSSKETLTAPPRLKKLKKHRVELTKEHLDLVKEFENNFILNEEHYSDTLKKVRDTKFGRPSEEPCASRDSTPPNDQESSLSDILDDDEGDMSLVVSNDLIGQLQNKFGPIPNIYGSELVVKLPVSLARQIYSYTLDSICQHVEDEQNVFDLLIKEDEAFARKLQDESIDTRGAMSFQEIMDHEMALRAHERERGQASAASSETFASRLSQQLLAERFPNMDPATLQNVLDVTNHSLHEATNLLASAGHVPVEPAAQEASKNSNDAPTYTMSREESIEQANAYHEVASKLNDMRQLYFQKAKESFNSGNHAVALFYRELFNWYSDQIKASNAKAAKAMLHGNEGATTLDLHYLHVSEAVGVLDLFLDESIRQLSSRKMEIFIITGRGLHSMDGKSKLKPAIKLRLKQRGLKYAEVNPGMVKTVLTKSSTVSYKLSGVE